MYALLIGSTIAQSVPQSYGSGSEEIRYWTRPVQIYGTACNYSDLVSNIRDSFYQVFLYKKMLRVSRWIAASPYELILIYLTLVKSRELIVEILWRKLSCFLRSYFNIRAHSVVVMSEQIRIPKFLHGESSNPYAKNLTLWVCALRHLETCPSERLHLIISSLR